MTGAPDPPPRSDLPPPAGRRDRAVATARDIRAGSRRALPFAAGILAALVAILLYSLLNPPARPLTARDVNQAVASALASQTPGPPRSQLVYEAVRPSIVLIQTDIAAVAGSPGPGGSPGPAASPENGLGTGVVVNDAGAVLTALHVVSGTTSIRLTYPDGSTTAATVATERPELDIAVLLPETLPAHPVPATLGNPASMRIGSEAYIVGNPYGLYGSLSSGVVSGLDRTFELPDSQQVIHGLIQVDAAVNPGNSGGPLLDRGGRVVGIVTALVNPTKQNVFIGIGLAVPIDVAGGAAGLPAY
jgi:S1-C subfamily serine protease